MSGLLATAVNTTRLSTDRATLYVFSDASTLTVYDDGSTKVVAIPTGPGLTIAQQAELEIQRRPKKILAGVYAVAAAGSMAASAYHGYKRNHSIGWALAWGASGLFFPLITPTIALAQGFARRAHA